MKTLQSALYLGISLALLRLQTWFDPAQSGSPYELEPIHRNTPSKKQYAFFSKKLSIRV